LHPPLSGRLCCPPALLLPSISIYNHNPCIRLACLVSVFLHSFNCPRHLLIIFFYSSPPFWATVCRHPRGEFKRETPNLEVENSVRRLVLFSVDPFDHHESRRDQPPTPSESPVPRYIGRSRSGLALLRAGFPVILTLEGTPRSPCHGKTLIDGLGYSA
jgi:hypothetical protein